jgi:hypothetical protein
MSYFFITDAIKSKLECPNQAILIKSNNFEQSGAIFSTLDFIDIERQK